MMELIDNNLVFATVTFFVIVLLPGTVDLILYKEEKDNEYPELVEKFDSGFLSLPYFYLVGLPSLFIRLILKIPLKKSEPIRVVAKKHEELTDEKFYKDMRERYNGMSIRYHLSLVSLVVFTLSVPCIVIYGQNSGIISQDNLRALNRILK